MNKFDQALDHIKNRNFIEAKNIFEALLKDDPSNPDILYNLGMCFTEIGAPDKAINFLERCLEYSPDFVNAYVALGFAYSCLKKPETAKKYFIKALEKDHSNPYAMRNLGALFGSIGENEKALYYLEKAYSLEPKDPQIVYGLGYIYKLLGDHEKADKFLKEVLKLKAPENINEFAKDALREIAEQSFKSKGVRMDAVFYLLGALQNFSNKSYDDIKRITYEISMKGRNGFDINSPEQKYTLTSMDGNFSGLHLVCYMYVGIQKIEPSLDAGIDLSSEYKIALSLFNSEDIVWH